MFSAETVNQMLADVPDLIPILPADAQPAAALAYIQAQQPESPEGLSYVSWKDWLILDEIEKEKGKASGRPRVKFTNISEMRIEMASRRGK